MARIGYAPSVATVRLSSLYNSGTKSIGNMVIITEDGFLMAKDKMFRIPLTTDTDTTNIYNITVTNTNGSLKVGAGGYVPTEGVSVLIDATNGNMTTANVTNGIVKFSHNTPTQAASDTSIGPSSGSSSSIVVPYFTYDAYGHITSATTSTATLNQVKQNTFSDTETYYVLAGKAGNGNNGETYYNSNITIDKDGNLYATKLYVGKTDVETLIHSSNAMYYQGSVNSESDLPSSPKNGDTYIVATAGTYKSIYCEVGDYLIASVASNNATSWTVIQGNVKGAVTTSGDTTNLTQYGIVYASDKDSKIVSTTAAGTAGQYLTGSGTTPVWANFLTLTITDGKNSSTYSPYSSYSNNQTTFTFTGSGGATVTNTNGTINIATDNDNTTYKLYASALNSSGNASTDVNTDSYLRLVPSSGDANLIKISGTGATTITTGADNNGVGSLIINSVNTEYTHNTLSFKISDDSSFAFTGGLTSTTAAATKTIIAGNKIAFSMTDNQLTIGSNWDVKANQIKTAYVKSTSSAVLESTTIGANKDLVFGDDFLFSNDKIELAWAEIDDKGYVTYLT